MDRRRYQLTAMVAHIGRWTTGTWVVLGVFLGILALGIALALLDARGRTGYS